MWCAAVSDRTFWKSSYFLALALARATQHLFYRVGRAMIKPIFAQKASHSGAVGPRLKRALRWWLSVLDQGISECRPWAMSEAEPCRLFVDAASTPARLAAVLFCDGLVYYSDGAPSMDVWRQLAKRGDKQITSLVCFLAVGCASHCTSSVNRRFWPS